ncbi:MAG: DNA polymerase III subunit delta [Firmicutes bacterium]|nr:DNA polymerase III subunit delta [Bacillota bacterium]MDH7494999.1 DNA polymerase III subunit delta [Bacillota bacterium]
MASGPGELAADVRSGRLRPVYLLYGEEGYLRDEAARTIADACLAPDTRDFNYVVFRAREADLESVVAAVLSPPAFAERRVVMVRGFDELSADEQKSLAEALRRMPRTSVVILVAEAVDERTTACRAIAEIGRVVRYRSLYDNEAASWLARHARDKGIDLDREARDYLVRTIGTSAARLAEAMEKARNYAGVAAPESSSSRGAVVRPQQKVTLEHVMAASAGEPALGIFDLVDALGAKDGAKAIAAARRLLSFGEPSTRILSMVARQIRLILRTRILLEEGAPLKRIADATRLQDSMVRKYVGQARNFTREELEDTFEVLAETDVGLKTSSAPEGVMIEGLIARLCAERAPSVPSRQPT